MIYVILVIYFKLIFELLQKCVSFNIINKSVIVCINNYNFIKIHRTQICLKNLKLIIAFSV